MKQNKFLLPNGLKDKLDDKVNFSNKILQKILLSFKSFGYEHIQPPLIEFEDSLLVQNKASQNIFRIMDPLSLKMMGVRCDITPQIARIATSRFRKKQRPLKLCYSGEVLQVYGGQLRQDRQFTQIGGEIIGSNDNRSDYENIVTAFAALKAAGIKHLYIDICMPTLVGIILTDANINNEKKQQVLSILDKKDNGELLVNKAKIPDKIVKILSQLLQATGSYKTAIELLKQIDLPKEAVDEINRIKEVVDYLAINIKDGLSITIDPIERRGFEYQTGLSFTLFATDISGELGRGGRYNIINDDGTTEPAVGFSFYMDTLLQAIVNKKTTSKKIMIAADISFEKTIKLQEQGYITIASLDYNADLLDEAKRLKCNYILQNNIINKLD